MDTILLALRVWAYGAVACTACLLVALVLNSAAAVGLLALAGIITTVGVLVALWVAK